MEKIPKNVKSLKNLIPFKKGNPGGPGRGKSKKVDVRLRNEIKKIVQKSGAVLETEQLKRLVEYAYDRALEGNSSYAKLVFDKFIAESRKRTGDPLKKTNLKTVTDVADAMEEITNQLRANTIDIDTATTLMNMYKMTGDFVRDTAIDDVNKVAKEIVKAQTD